jgi:hypothetical protein
VPKLAPLGLTGDVLLRVASLSIERNEMQGNATLQWRDAGSVERGQGSFELQLN